jgi:peptidoglycan/xylan/chitin deacetylase (PgdA/CDA1 family)
VISFTFDDFPRSALHTGGVLLNRYGAAGTYYVALGLMGKEEPSGTMFVQDDLKVVFEHGHELGCHTYGHCDAGKTRPDAFETSVLENQRALGALCPGSEFKTLSYPISFPRVGTKRRAGRHYVCCRGGGQSFNAGKADLNCLDSFFLEQSRENPQRVWDVIEENRRARGWLILSTHDISTNPSPYGCTPGFFEEVIQHAVESGARILTVLGAYQFLSAAS